MWGALLYGGRLVVVPYHVTRSPQLELAYEWILVSSFSFVSSGGLVSSGHVGWPHIFVFPELVFGFIEGNRMLRTPDYFG